MYLSQSNIDELRDKVENGGGFQVAIVPMQSETFLNVKLATDNLYEELTQAGLSVIVDDRKQKPNNKFEVIEFLKIRHRVVISSRSISAKVFEYKDLDTDEFEKIAQTTAIEFLKQRVFDANNN
ncbi:His/Gly/Thr/Pro-type tRNA ligase C-terminal domain-containing protein [uncultured Cocleimonas sp.]|uniref:His/Gly/Thr/Pro-type tRNA ligase C-terminal domain-containing protein n=1 Tax=uncultured Cocleimonas sp. TaxID=1051587 RepID=UPI00260F0BC7|nr:His/Gly/Thr/Pro-type tRNA ligase C-terminal domain-containing protein [uncultured Cocleimonas sp.]